MDTSLEGKRIGIAMTGSFCTFESVFSILRGLKKTNCLLFPILSTNAYGLDTRFYTAQEVRETLIEICGHEIWHTIPDVEPIGPKKLLDLLIVMPCTGNTLSKLSHGIADTPVTMACKSHLRNDRPVLLGVSTNDGLSGNAGNIGTLMNRKNIYFIPFCQDDPMKKPCSLIFCPEEVEKAAVMALQYKQMQPLLKICPAQ